VYALHDILNIQDKLSETKQTTCAQKETANSRSVLRDCFNQNKLFADEKKKVFQRSLFVISYTSRFQGYSVQQN